MHLDAVVDSDSQIHFTGSPREVVDWLDERPAEGPLWVHMGRTTQILTASEYIDLSD